MIVRRRRGGRGPAGGAEATLHLGGQAMQRRMLSLLAMCCTAVVGIAAAQTPSARFGLGGGATVPVGDYKDLDKIGWHGLGLVQFAVPASPVDIRVDALYGQTTHKDIGTTPVPGNSKLYGGLVSLVYNVGPKLMARPYVLGVAGVYHEKITTTSGTGTSEFSESKFAFGGGGGVAVGMGPAHFFVEARWVSVRTSGAATNFFPLTAGVTFGK